MKQIISLIVSFISCNSNPINNCNDECLLNKLGITNGNQEVILNGYDIFNNEFIDNALIWIHPSSYFSDSFMKQIANSKTIPTDDKFRDSVYRKYIASKNISFKLSIYDTVKSKDKMQNMLKQYHFDGYIEYKIKKKNNRVLLGNYGQGDDETLEFDILNQRTYDEYDWFLYGFTIFTFGCLCMCCGWCSHKKYVKDKIIEDDDVQSLATPISPSGDGKETKYSFAGFNIFGENMHRDASKTTSNEQQLTDHISNQVYDIDPMQYQEILSKTGTKGTPTFGSIMPSMPSRDPRMLSNASTNSQMSDIELAENTHRNGIGTISSGVGHQYHNSHTLSPEFKPRDNSSLNTHNAHSRTITPLQIISPSLTPKVPNGYSGNHLSADPRLLAQRQQIELLAHAKQFGLYDDNNSADTNDNDETPQFGHDISHKSASHAKFGHNHSNTMTMIGTPVTHYGAQVTLGHTPIPPSRASHAAQNSFPQDLIVYEDPDGNIVGVAQVGANGEIVSTQPLSEQLPQLFANHSPNNLRPSRPTSARSLPGMSPQNSGSPRNVPPPISVGTISIVDDNKEQKNDNSNNKNNEVVPPSRPTLITLMSNPDQKQKRSVPHIIMPTKESAIIPKYKTEIVASPGTTDVIASPDSEDPSQTHLSLDICIGTSNSVDGKSGAYGRVILPLKDNDSLQTPVIEEDTELEDRILDAAFRPAPPPGTPPNKSSRGTIINNNNGRNKPRPPPGPPPRDNASIPVNMSQDVGLEVIVEGPEDEEVMSPESVHSLRKTYEDAIASDIIPQNTDQDINK